MLVAELIELEAAARHCAKSCHDAAAGLLGLESRFETAIEHLGQPRTQEELQGLAELLVMTTQLIRGQCETNAVAMHDLSVAIGRQLEALAAETNG